jgi:hypothetical protein
MITFSNRQISGTQTFDAARLVEAADVPTGREILVMEISPEAADNIDPTKGFRLAVFVSSDGVTFLPLISATWKGDPTNVGAPPIRIWVSAPPMVGKRLRAEVAMLGGRMRVGGSVLVRLPQGDEL